MKIVGWFFGDVFSIKNLNGTSPTLSKLRSSYWIFRFRAPFSASCWRFLGMFIAWRISNQKVIAGIYRVLLLGLPSRIMKSLAKNFISARATRYSGLGVRSVLSCWRFLRNRFVFPIIHQQPWLCPSPIIFPITPAALPGSVAGPAAPWQPPAKRHPATGPRTPRRGAVRGGPDRFPRSDWRGQQQKHTETRSKNTKKMW